MIVVKMVVDESSTVYGLDFIDCLVQLEREGVFPNDTLPHVCEFTALSIDAVEYSTLMESSNDNNQSNEETL